MDPVLRLFQSHERSRPGIHRDRAECENAQGSLRQDAGGALNPCLAHGQIQRAAVLVHIDAYAFDARNDGAEAAGNRLETFGLRRA